MSYKISYDNASGKDKIRLNSRNWLLVAAGIVLTLVVSARVLYPEKTKQFMEALFPLTSDSSQEALEVFAENIKAGESFGDAVTAFCLEIINETDSN